MTQDTGTGLHSIRVDYKLIPVEQQATRGEWYFQATLIREYRDSANNLQTKTTPLGRIDVDALASVEQRTAFWKTTNEALDGLHVEGETRDHITAELILVVRLGTDDMAKLPRIGLGAIFPNDK